MDLVVASDVSDPGQLLDFAHQESLFSFCDKVRGEGKPVYLRKYLSDLGFGCNGSLRWARFEEVSELSLFWS